MTDEREILANLRKSCQGDGLLIPVPRLTLARLLDLEERVRGWCERTHGKQMHLAVNGRAIIPEQDSPAVSIQKRDREAVMRVFAFWQKTTGHTTAKLTKERGMKVLGRLANYTEEQIKQAIVGCARSPHNRGENERGERYDDLELICRNDTKLEQFIAKGESHYAPQGPAANGNEDKIKNLRAQADKALAEGRTDAFNDANRKMRELQKGVKS